MLFIGYTFCQSQDTSLARHQQQVFFSYSLPYFMLFKISLQNYDFSFVISVTFGYNFVTFSSLEKKNIKKRVFCYTF